MKLERITYNPDPLSHHSEYIQQFITQGIKIDGVHYFIEEYLIEDNKLFAIVSVDKRTFYKYPISTSVNENTEDINKLIEELKKSNDIDKQSLSINGKELSISNGNTVELPEETDPVFKEVMTSTFEGYTDGTDFKEWSSSQLTDLRNAITIVSVDVKNLKDYKEYSDDRDKELDKSIKDNKYDVDDKVHKLDERLKVVESKDDTELKTSVSELKSDVNNLKEHPGIKSITIEGRGDLAELSTNEDGGTTITLKGDNYKINQLKSKAPYLIPSYELSIVNNEGTNDAIINQDLSLFPLNDGELVKVSKERNSLAINDSKIKEFVTNTITEVLNKVPITVANIGSIINQFDRQETNVSFENDEGFNHYLLVTVIRYDNAVSLFKFSREDFINDEHYKIVNDFVISIKAELTEDKHLILTFNTHDTIDIHEYQIMFEWFTDYESAPTDSIYKDKRIKVIHSVQTDHFEGYKNPTEYTPNVPLTYQPNIPTEESH